jgi:ABC-type multidrug transport system ATPase subunit
MTNVDAIIHEGGQRRRVTVGEMMQGQNAVACADEISTGLDAAVTYDICNSIVTFAKAAKTTRIVSLLQPGPETFSLFDEVVLLSEGMVVYAGPIVEVVAYFESLGYIQPSTMDVADFLQSIPTSDGTMLFDKDSSPYDEHLTAAEFAEAFKKSPQYQRISRDLNRPYAVSWKGRDGESSVPEQFKKPFQNSFCRALNLNLHRHLVLWKRDYGFIIGKAFENIGMAVATGGSLRYSSFRVPC